MEIPSFVFSGTFRCGNVGFVELDGVAVAETLFFFSFALLTDRSFGNPLLNSPPRPVGGHDTLFLFNVLLFDASGPLLMLLLLVWVVKGADRSLVTAFFNFVPFSIDFNKAALLGNFTGGALSDKFGAGAGAGGGGTGAIYLFQLVMVAMTRQFKE